MNRKTKNGIKVLTAIVITMTFALTGLTTVLADDTTLKTKGKVTTYESLIPLDQRHPLPGEEPPETMDYYPLGVNGETFDTDLGLFTEHDNSSKPTANDWEWNGADGNPAGCAYHAGAGPYDTVTLEDYLVSSCIPTQFFGTYTVAFDYKGVGFVNIYYTWEDPVTNWAGSPEHPWYYVGTFGNAGTWTNSGALAMPPTGIDQCNCIYLVFEAYANGVGEDIGIDNVVVEYLFTGMDIDVIELVKPDPDMGQQVAPPEVWIKVANVGTEWSNSTDLHLQIYEEIDYQPEIDNCNDFESECCDEWPFYPFDWDCDGMTWARTDRRSFSGDYSWRCTPCDRAVYAGNAMNSLYSKPKKIPEWENHVWLNFTTWVQGEVVDVYTGYYKLEDYMMVSISILNQTTGNWSDWMLLKKVGDTGGEWTYIENVDETAGEGIDFTLGHQDHWLCEKGSGAPKKWWGGIDLTDGYGFNGTDFVKLGDLTGDGNFAGGDVFKLNFTWVSDPCDQFEGAYIDDVCILSGRGEEQPLVYNEYKNLKYPLAPGETVTVRFPLVSQYWTPKEDTWYFFEVYSDAENDVDGPQDNNYTMKYTTKIIPDPYYRDPWNGVNETIYFGNLLDAAVIHVAVDKEFELEMQQCSSVQCYPVPIEITVFNNGTYTQDIPVTLEIAKKLNVEIFADDFEDGTLDKWQGAYSADHQGDILGLNTDWMPANGDRHLAIADERMMYHNHHGAGVFSLAELPVPAGDFPIYFDFNAMWALENDGHASGEATSIYYAPFDCFAMGLEDPVSNSFLFAWPTSNLIYPEDSPTMSTIITGHSGYAYTSFEKYWDLRPYIEHYQALGYLAEVMTAGFYLRSDEADCYEDELPLNGGACLQDDCAPFGGVMIDDVSIYYEAPGEVIYTDTQVVTVDPKEEVVVEFIWDACTYCDFFVVGKTELEGDCNPDNDEARNETYLYHEIFFDDIEEENTHWSTDDNTYGEPGDWYICDDDRCINTDHVWYSNNTAAAEAYEPADVLMINEVFDWTEVDNVELCFNFWEQMEWLAAYDYVLLEISNNSGQSWYYKWFWTNSTNYEENEEVWQHLCITLFNTSAGQPLVVYNNIDGGWVYYAMYYLVFLGNQAAYDFYINLAKGTPTIMDITDQMHIRWTYLPNGAWTEKGFYLDDVFINTTTNESVVMNGGVYTKPWEWVKTVLFHDDMEDPAASAEKWLVLKDWTDDKWHRTDHSYYSYNTSWWCAEEHGFSSYLPYTYENWFGTQNISYHSSPMEYRDLMDDKLILTLDLSDKWKGYLTYDIHYNFSDNADYLAVEISNDGGATWKELIRYTNATNTNCEWVHENGIPAADPYARGYHGIKITPWLPGEIMIRFRMISNATGTDMGVELDNVRITGAPDCNAPTTTCILNPPLPDGNEGWYVSNVQVTLVAQDDREVAATYYSIDGGSWLTYTAPVTISADGQHTVSYYSVDGVGNAEDAKFCTTFKIDKTAPSASLSSPQAGYIYLFGRELMPRILNKDSALIIGGFTATATASDGGSGVDYVKFSTGAGSGEDAVSPYEFNLPFYFPFGSDTLSVSVTDVAGNSANDGSVSYTKIL